MKIVVVDIAASSGGALTVLNNLYKHICDNDILNDWHFLLCDNFLEETPNIKVSTFPQYKKWSKRLMFDFVDGKKFINSFNPDLVLSLQNTIVAGVAAPQIVFLHQSIPFQNAKRFSFFKSSERKMAVYQHLIGKMISESIKRADHTIVQSKWMEEEVVKVTGIDVENISCMFPKVDTIFPIVKDTNFNKNSFFYPAADYIYKNHKIIYDAVKILNSNGIDGFDIELTLERESSQKNISFIGEIPFERVLEKYNRSTLIFPSYIETIGMPLLEAKQVGSIILVADCSYSREVLKDYNNAYFFNPFEPVELANLIKKVINDEIKKEKTNRIEENSSKGWEMIQEIGKKLN